MRAMPTMREHEWREIYSSTKYGPRRVRAEECPRCGLRRDVGSAPDGHILIRYSRAGRPVTKRGALPPMCTDGKHPEARDDQMEMFD